MAGKPIELVLRVDQRYGNHGQTLRPGTLVATLTFDDGIPPNLANLQFLGSALAQATVIDASHMPSVRVKPKPYEPPRSTPYVEPEPEPEPVDDFGSV